MKYSISYFYQIRFLKPNQIPLSTALFDPGGFHAFKGNDHVFKDRRGVINGLRIKLLNPQTSECQQNCPYKNKGECPFLQHYSAYLNSIDFGWFRRTLEKDIQIVADEWGIKDPEVVLIVYETPNNPCSERGPLMKWFKDNGVELNEFTIQPISHTVNLLK